MINLLPTDHKENILYARRNTGLIRWLSGLTLGMIAIVLVVLMGVFFIEYSTRQFNKQVVQAEQELKSLKVDETEKQAEDMSNNFKLVTQVLSKQVLFSKALTHIGEVMPDGASLANLSIEGLEGGIDLIIDARDYQTATQVQVNLEDPSNKLFEKVDIISVSCRDSADTEPTSEYPCTGRFRALFTSGEHPFLLLNTAEEKKP